MLTAHRSCRCYSRGIARPSRKDWIGIARIASAHHSTGQPSAYTAAELPHALSASALSYPQTPSPRRDDIERPQLKASAKATRKCRASNATK